MDDYWGVFLGYFWGADFGDFGGSFFGLSPVFLHLIYVDASRGMTADVRRILIISVLDMYYWGWLGRFLGYLGRFLSFYIMWCFIENLLCFWIYFVDRLEWGVFFWFWITELYFLGRLFFTLWWLICVYFKFTEDTEELNALGLALCWGFFLISFLRNLIWRLGTQSDWGLLFWDWLFGISAFFFILDHGRRGKKERESVMGIWWLFVLFGVEEF